MWNLAYGPYEKRLRGEPVRGSIPRHIGVILDGNRCQTRPVRIQASQSHRVDADKISGLLGWVDEAGVEIVILWVFLIDNLLHSSEELGELLGIIADAVDHPAAQEQCFTVAGDLNLPPGTIAERIRSAVASTSSRNTIRVSIVIDYRGRHEVIETVRQIISDATAEGISLGELANTLTDADTTDHLYTKDQPDPDLIIRTLGEQHLSGFVIWQSVHSGFYFCETYWPDLRHVDFLRAICSYGRRERRLRH